MGGDSEGILTGPLISKVQAFAGGVTFAGALYFIGAYIGSTVGPTDLQPTVDQFIIPLFSSLFISLATGHYLGKAVEKDHDSVTSFIIGLFLTLFVGMIYINRVSYLTGILSLVTISVFMMHSSDMINSHKEIESFVEIVAGQVSTTGLALIAMIKYVVPVVQALAEFVMSYPS